MTGMSRDDWDEWECNEMTRDDYGCVGCLRMPGMTRDY